MRGLRMMVVALACAGSMVAAHGQIGGDEPGGKPETSAPAPANKPVKISSAVMQGLLKKKVDPVYPQDTPPMEVTVVIHAIIGKDGRLQSAQAVSGPVVFRGAALEAVRQWIYKPYLLNGEPVEVDTTVVVEFHSRQR